MRLLVLAAPLALVLCASAARPGAQQHPAPLVFWKNTTLDWFRFTPDAGPDAAPTSFAQRVLYTDAFWDTTARTGPLLVFFGGEGACEDFWDNSGALFDMARGLAAKVVFLEHRYYGQSLPFGAASYGDRQLRFLTVEQALADMSDLLANKQRLLGCAGGRGSCDAVLFGGSYGGMQVAWHRLKYPHLSVGGVAASAPVDIWPGEHKSAAFLEASLFTYYKYGSPACAAWMKRALERIHVYATAAPPSADGYALLGASFRTCEPLATQEGVARLLMYVNGAVSTMAMVDYPFAASFVTPMPASPVRHACDAAGQAPTPPAGPEDGKDDAWLFAALNGLQNVFLNYTAQLRCHNTSAELLRQATLGPRGGGGGGGGGAKMQRPPSRASLAGLVGSGGPGLGDITRPWNYMACSSLILEPLTSDGAS